jgi:hypothetical protein
LGILAHDEGRKKLRLLSDYKVVSFYTAQKPPVLTYRVCAVFLYLVADAV